MTLLGAVPAVTVLKIINPVAGEAIVVTSSVPDKLILGGKNPFVVLLTSNCADDAGVLTGPMVPENHDGPLVEEPVGTSMGVPHGTRGSDRVDLLRLRTLGALTNLELDALVLIESLEAVRLDGRVVNEDVLVSAVNLDEAVALFLVEPLHCA